MFLFFVYNDLGMKYDYETFYRKLSAPVQNHPEAVRRADLLISSFVFFSYPALLAALLAQESSECVKMIIIPAVSLAVVSAMRRLIGRKRPFETYDIEPMIPRETCGCSFPSRHVFSCTVITMCFMRTFPAFGWVLLVLTAAEMYLRTAGGVHYPSDVAAGAAAGILAGLFLFL